MARRLSPSAVKIVAAHRVAVDGGIIERRHIDRRDDIFGEHAAQRFAQRHGLAAVDRRHPLGNQALGFGDRKQRAVKGEAIVAELRHHGFSRAGADLLARQRLGLQHVGDRLDIVEHHDRHLRLRQRRVGGDRDDAIVVGMQQRLADGGAKDFELRDARGA